LRELFEEKATLEGRLREHIEKLNLYTKAAQQEMLACIQGKMGLLEELPTAPKSDHEEGRQ
jgi:hypothetical protein